MYHFRLNSYYADSIILAVNISSNNVNIFPSIIYKQNMFILYEKIRYVQVYIAPYNFFFRRQFFLKGCALCVAFMLNKHLANHTQSNQSMYIKILSPNRNEELLKFAI